jgi:hypothetical protein
MHARNQRGASRCQRVEVKILLGRINLLAELGLNLPSDFLRVMDVGLVAKVIYSLL